MPSELEVSKAKGENSPKAKATGTAEGSDTASTNSETINTNGRGNEEKTSAAAKIADVPSNKSEGINENSISATSDVPAASNNNDLNQNPQQQASNAYNNFMAQVPPTTTSTAPTSNNPAIPVTQIPAMSPHPNYSNKNATANPLSPPLITTLLSSVANQQPALVPLPTPPPIPAPLSSSRTSNTTTRAPDTQQHAQHQQQQAPPPPQQQEQQLLQYHRQQALQNLPFPYNTGTANMNMLQQFPLALLHQFPLAMLAQQQQQHGTITPAPAMGRGPTPTTANSNQPLSIPTANTTSPAIPLSFGMGTNPINMQIAAALQQQQLQQHQQQFVPQNALGATSLLTSGSTAFHQFPYNQPVVKQMAPSQSSASKISFFNEDGIVVEVSANPTPSSTATRTAPLYLDYDDRALTEYQCLLRQQVELFEATSEDVRGCAQGRHSRIRPGQVGIRCRHCSHLPKSARARGAIYYSKTIDGMYQVTQNMSKLHLCKNCTQVPEEIKRKLAKLQTSHTRASGGKEYWSEGLRVLGVVEVGGILKFKPQVMPSQPTLEIPSDTTLHRTTQAKIAKSATSILDQQAKIDKNGESKWSTVL
jgi:hypothetical protein